MQGINNGSNAFPSNHAQINLLILVEKKIDYQLSLQHAADA